MRVFRLAKHHYAPLDTTGAGRLGGRWNPPGVPVLYTAQSVALATLEILVHLGDPVTLQYYDLYEIGVPDAAVVDLEDILAAKDIQALLANRYETQAFGGEWLKQANQLALRVPSVTVPMERNVLLNPAHPAYRSLKAIKLDYRVDERLLKWNG